MKFDLAKATEKAKFVIAKKGLPTVKAAVVLNLDVSGSAKGLYQSGAIQRTFQTIVPLAINFDDNASLNVFTFADDDRYTTQIQPDASAANFEDYISKRILNDSSVPKWNGTHYAQVLRANLEMLGFIVEETTKGGFFSKDKTQEVIKADNGSGYPALIITLTDGENFDQRRCLEDLATYEKQKVNAYFLFIGIGSANFQNIVELGDKFGNVGFLNVSDLEKFADSDDVYDQLLPQELVEWFAKSGK
jgi:hypothetical protein